ncbi:MAG: 2OG-Fe(II) oxygenase [Azospirillaceae bacterium]
MSEASTAAGGAVGAGATPTVLDRARPADIRRDPFPHLVVRDALPAAVYDRLAATRPDSDTVAWAGPKPSNIRLPLSARRILDHPAIDPAWKAFVAAHAAPAFLARVLDLFAEVWPDLPPDPAALARAGTTLLDVTGMPDGEPGDGRVHLDARLELNTPVTGGESRVRGPHVDTANRLYSGLFYLRAADDPTPGGDLVLYRWRGGAVRDPLRYEIPDAEVEAVARVPYAANTLVLFPNHPHALHGVTARPPTPHERAYVFLTAEVVAHRFGA